MKNVVNLDEVVLHPRPPEFRPDDAATAAKYDARMGMLGAMIGTVQLGCNITLIPPGKRAFPFHNHRVNEELFIILEGQGELRYGGQHRAVRANDVISCPAGGPETAHQIVNTGSADLKMIAISTQRMPEICDYPDSGKFGLLAEFPSHSDTAAYRHITREADCRDYWENE